MTLQEFERQHELRLAAQHGRRGGLCGDVSPPCLSASYLCTRPAGHGDLHEARLSTGQLLASWRELKVVTAIGEDEG